MTLILEIVFIIPLFTTHIARIKDEKRNLYTHLKYKDIFRGIHRNYNAGNLHKCTFNGVCVRHSVSEFARNFHFVDIRVDSHHLLGSTCLPLD